MSKRTLGIIGVGAFGELAAKHLAPHFRLVLHDAHRDPARIAKKYRAKNGTLADAAKCDIVVLAVPVQRFREVLEKIAPMIGPDALVVDVASVKVRPLGLMKAILPSTARIVGTHPLFGPQSGRRGIAGLNIVVCPVTRGADGKVRRFCRETLGLRVFVSTADEHDRNMAYVQGLTHYLSRIVLGMDLPPLKYTTRTYDLMEQMVGMVRSDSDELFRAIEQENPYAAGVKEAFLAAVGRIEAGHRT